MDPGEKLEFRAYVSVVVRVFLLTLVLVGCSASPEGAAFDERTPSTPLEHAGQNSGGSSAGSSLLKAGSGGSNVGESHNSNGGSSGAATMLVAGSGGAPSSTAGATSGGSSAGQGSGGTSTTAGMGGTSADAGSGGQAQGGMSGSGGSGGKPSATVCPYPTWTIGGGADFKNPFHPGTYQWWPGDKVRAPNSTACYVCIAVDGCPYASPGGPSWQPVSCEC